MERIKAALTHPCPICKERKTLVPLHFAYACDHHYCLTCVNGYLRRHWAECPLCKKAFRQPMEEMELPEAITFIKRQLPEVWENAMNQRGMRRIIDHEVLMIKEQRREARLTEERRRKNQRLAARIAEQKIAAEQQQTSVPKGQCSVCFDYADEIPEGFMLAEEEEDLQFTMPFDCAHSMCSSCAFAYKACPRCGADPALIPDGAVDKTYDEEM